jgi:ThiF family
VNERTIGKRIGIVGGGGTGAYVLDFVAKTWVAEIYLFDGDVFSQHNAFRAPGAPSLQQLEARPQKVAYLKAIYENMRNGIVAHDGYLEGDSLALLDGLDFVFLCLDRGAVKRPIVERLIANGTPFVEVGMGVVLSDGQLSGIVRTVTSTPETRAEAAPHVSYAAEDGVANDYATNIQIAELNAINAAIAVIQWKKMLGIYQDTRGQYYTGYSISSGEVISESKK